MLEGIGLYTVGGVLVTIITGKVTPLSCYIGLGPHSGSGTELVGPIGTLGCQYDQDRLRIFLEHQSSPATGSDHPGFNHAGIKYLVPFPTITPYAGASVALNEFNNMGNLLGIVGVETNGNTIRLYGEHIFSLNNPETGHSVAGIKIIF
jgi:hypothetical protein